MALLGFLARGSRTGYELKALMERSVGFFFGASYGSIYPALKSLAGEGLVRVEEVVQSGRPNKKIYTITPEGRQRFRASLREEEPSGDVFRSEFLMHLFFGDEHDPRRLLELIGEYRSRCEARLERLRDVEEEFGKTMTPYQRMTLDFGLSHFRGRLEWIREVEDRLRSLAARDGPEQRQPRQEAQR